MQQTMQHGDHSGSRQAEQRSSLFGSIGGGAVQNLSTWHHNSGMHNDRRGSLDLLGALAGAQSESSECRTNNAAGSNIPDSPFTAFSSGNSGNFSAMETPIPLGLPADKDWLTPLHCFVRLNCVEVFTATEADVSIPTKGKRKPIQIGQVGIRCPHCHNSDSGLKSRERGSVYYPTR